MKLSTPLLVLILAFLTTGCLGGRVFYVDERFTLEEQAQIQAAADSWAAVGAPTIDLAFGQRVSDRDTGRRVIVRSGERGALQTSEEFKNSQDTVMIHEKVLDFERIIVDIDRAEGVFQKILAHEFGHHYGLEHSQRATSIMFAYPEVEAPTASDGRAAIALE